MSEASGVSEQVLSLPDGGGAVKGTGGSFETSLQTGAGRFSLPIDLPDGRNGSGPSLSLTYSSGNGNSRFGLGWSLSTSSISRKTQKGVPRYDGSDTFRVGSGDLVAVAAEDEVVRYRPRADEGFRRIRRHRDSQTDHWTVESRDGTTTVYGTPESRGDDPAVVADPDDPDRVYQWMPSVRIDEFGNRTEYEYRRDADGRWDQLYLERIRYGEYEADGEDSFLVTVEFTYEERPDPFSRHRPGFEVRTRLRCAGITVRSHADTTRRVRRYEFTYADEQGDAPRNGLSLLTRVDVIGHDDDETQRLPPQTFDYTGFEPEDRTFETVTGPLPWHSLGDPELELADLFGDGLPDVVEISDTVRYWRNKGECEFADPVEMDRSPGGLSLADPGVRLMDANGDGRIDLVVDTDRISGYYPLTLDGGWDAKSFQPYEQAPSVAPGDPGVAPVDLDGNGVTDLVRSGDRMEYFFQDPADGWTEPRQTPGDPDVDVADPRVRFADLTGDGLSDLVVIRQGSVEYRPNQGYGEWGRRVRMRNPPRLPADYDPGRVLVGDVDGDGHADLVYVEDDRVQVWLNRSGNGWSDPIGIDGTPSVTDTDAVRLVDLKGHGIAGVLWTGSGSPTDSSREAYFLSFTGKEKPHLLTEAANNLGARTRISYRSSTAYLLADRESGDGWETSLPSPTQVVSDVEIHDEISGRVTTREYAYHDGYWDGAEREYRGFGAVDQRDSESYPAYSDRVDDGGRAGPIAAGRDRFSPPTLTRTWFHLGAVGPERGNWSSYDPRAAFWEGDPTWREASDPERGDDLPDDLERRGLRDAVRSLRGKQLRQEVYALDGSDRADRPYEVTEWQYGVRTEHAPGDGSSSDDPGVFFPHQTLTRTTTWERGDDPHTEVSFTGDYDAYGQSRATLSVACPRGWDPTVRPSSDEYLARYTETTYARRDDEQYMVDRAATTAEYELTDNVPRTVDSLWQAVRMGSVDVELVGLTRRYYDGQAYTGLPLGELGDHGAEVKVEELVMTDDLLDEAYGGQPRLTGNGPSTGASSAWAALTSGDGSFPGQEPPAYLTTATPTWDNLYPEAFRTAVPTRAGYVIDGLGDRRGSASLGYFSVSKRVQYDFQLDADDEFDVEGGPYGLVAGRKDSLGNETRIVEYAYARDPIEVRDPHGLVTEAEYDYAAMKPRQLTDPNGNRTRNGYTPLGLVAWVAQMGTEGEREGDTPEQPGVRFEYGLRAFEQSPPEDPQPAYVHESRRERHRWELLREERERRGRELTDAEVETLFADELERHPERFVQSREYSDGFGEVVQRRTQTEDVVHEADGGGPPLPGVRQDSPNAVVSRDRSDETPRVRVQGWETYDNKGNVVESYEPFFATGWTYLSRREAATTRPDTFDRKVETFYDAMYRETRTVRPDDSETLTVRGIPERLESPDQFEPTPWVVYEYDAVDNAGRTHERDAAEYRHRWNAPSTRRLDARGRTVETVRRNRERARPDGGATRALATPVETYSVTQTFDARGNPRRITDQLGRTAFAAVYDLNDTRLRTESLDAGAGVRVLDAAGNVVETRDGKGALDLRTYDDSNRLARRWARDERGGAVTLRDRVLRGETDPALSRQVARSANLLGNVTRRYDEAGLLAFDAYDFKNNPELKRRRPLADDLVGGGPVDWAAPSGTVADRESELLSARTHETSLEYDALGRIHLRRYPADVVGGADGRRALRFEYTPSGSLASVEMLPGDETTSTTYLEAVGYDAKGRRALVAYGNGVMTRHAYDEVTDRLVRSRTERFDSPETTSDAVIDRFEPAGDVFRDVTYEYDVGGSLLESRNEAPGAGVQGSTHGRNTLVREFSYDALDRLTEATGRECTTVPQPRPWIDAQPCGFDTDPGGTPEVTRSNAPMQTARYRERYQYDPAGNMRSMTHATVGDSDANGSWTRYFGYGGHAPADWDPGPGTDPDRGNRLTHVGDETPRPGGATHEYDANGNLLSERNSEYGWDYADRLRSYEEAAGGTTSVAASYAYDATGQRIKKVVDKKDHRREVTEYIDGIFEYHRLETDRTADDGGTVRENNALHVSDGSTRIALKRVGQRFDGESYAASDEPAIKYRINDRLGSCTLTVAGSGAWYNYEEYTPFGETVFGGYAKKRYRFTGKERDEESGLYYHGQRYYAPWLARWTTTDPEGTVDGLNLYLYVGNDPVNITDPTGKQGKETNESGGTGHVPGGTAGGEPTGGALGGQTSGSGSQQQQETHSQESQKNENTSSEQSIVTDLIMSFIHPRFYKHTLKKPSAFEFKGRSGLAALRAQQKRISWQYNNVTRRAINQRANMLFEVVMGTVGMLSEASDIVAVTARASMLTTKQGLRVAARTARTADEGVEKASEAITNKSTRHLLELGTEPTTGEFNFGEARAGGLVEDIISKRLKRDPTSAAEWVDPKGVEYDAVGTSLRAKHFDDSFFSSIEDHVRRQTHDVTVVDVSHLDEAQMKKTIQYIESTFSTQEQQNILVISRGTGKINQ